LAKHLVEVEGRVELSNDLASALVNKGIALSDLGHQWLIRRGGVANGQNAL
jgi:hypothetical protein